MVLAIPILTEFIDAYGMSHEEDDIGTTYCYLTTTKHKNVNRVQNSRKTVYMICPVICWWSTPHMMRLSKMCIIPILTNSAWRMGSIFLIMFQHFSVGWGSERGSFVYTASATSVMYSWFRIYVNYLSHHYFRKWLSTRKVPKYHPSALMMNH